MKNAKTKERKVKKEKMKREKVTNEKIKRGKVKKGKMKRKKALFLIAIAFFLIWALTMVIYSLFFLKASVMTVPIYVEVNSTIGINADTDALYYGRVSPGHGGWRKIDITNLVNYDQLVHVSFAGEVIDWMGTQQNDFILEPGEAKTVKIDMNVPSDIVYGKYEGEAIFTFTKAT